MRRTGIVLIIIGLLAGAAAVAWKPVAVPRLVKFPATLDRTDHYAGTFVTYVDRQNGTALAEPVKQDLTIDRHIASVPGETGARVALVKETLTATIRDQQTGATVGLPIVQESVYALDRRTMENVSDPRAYTFKEGNTPDRSGTYYLTMPMGLDSTGVDLRIWKPEAEASYPLVSTIPATGTEGGAKVVYLKGQIPDPLPVSSVELAQLQGLGLPTQLTPEQAGARLAAAGIDITTAAPALIPVLTPEELKAVTDVLGKSLPLKYFAEGSGITAVEPDTGGLVKLDGIVDRISVQPDMSSMAPAVAALKNHAAVPAIAAILGIFDQMAAAPPQPVFDMQYTQTPESVKDAADYALSQADKAHMAETTIPIALGVLAGVLVIAGIVMVLISRRRHPTAAAVVGTTAPVRSAA